MKKENTYVKNTVMLYLMTFAKLVFPFITFPYLTRVLSVEYYGIVTYVKSSMSYMQIVLEFGFLFSATKKIVEAKSDLQKIGHVTGDVLYAKLLLSVTTLIITVGMILCLDLLHRHELYTLLSLVAIILNSLLPDFLFQGLNRMQEISYRFIVCKAFYVVLVILFVKSDRDILLIPIFDMLSSLLALIISYLRMRKLHIVLYFGKIKDALKSLRESFSYFISRCAASTFSALNTIVVGIFLDAEQVAYWGVALQLIGVIQTLYSPIMDGIYPHMIKNKELKLIRRILYIFMPVVTIGCLICFIWSEEVITIVSGEKYRVASDVFCYLIPVLFISFPAQLFGFPCLGAIGRVKETTRGTITGALVQVTGIALLNIIGQFNLLWLAFIRVLAETAMLVVRVIYTVKYRKEFSQYICQNET